MNTVHVRDAKKSDLEKIKSLIIELIDAVNNTEGINIDAVTRNCESILDNKNSHFLVAEINDSVICFINFTIRETILHSAPSGLIDELVVSKDHRGKGVGRKLVQVAIEKCKQLGCCEVEVSTELSNINARKFYKKMGFKEKGLLFEMDL